MTKIANWFPAAAAPPPPPSVSQTAERSGADIVVVTHKRLLDDGEWPNEAVCVIPRPFRPSERRCGLHFSVYLRFSFLYILYLGRADVVD